jgi:hypothetical protein
MLAGDSRSTNGSQTAPTIPVTHTHNTSTVNQVSSSGVSGTPNDLLSPADTPTDAPPSYTPSANSPEPTMPTISEQELGTRLGQLQRSLAAKNKGSLSIRPYTITGKIDAIQLLYVGMTQLELTSRELGTPIYLHPTFRRIYTSKLICI